MPNHALPDSSTSDHNTSDPGTSWLTELDALVERWFFEAFHGSPVARSTETWNHVHAAKDELKRRLAAFLAEI